MKTDRLRDSINDYIEFFDSFSELIRKTVKAETVILKTCVRGYSAISSTKNLSNSTMEFLHRKSLNNGIYKNGVNVIHIHNINYRNKKLGILILVFSRKQKFKYFKEIFNTILSQADSAILQMMNVNRLIEKDKIIQIIYDIDSIRDLHLTFDNMMKRIVRRINRELNADYSFLTIYDRKTKLFNVHTTNRKMNRMIEDYLIDFSVHATKKNAVAKRNIDNWNTIGIPLIMEDDVIGVLGAMKNDIAFNEFETRVLKAVGTQTDTAIFENLEKRRLKTVLGRSVDPRVMKKLLQADDAGFLNGEKMNVTVLYADIRGSTEMSEQIDPVLLVQFISRYLSAMSDIAFENQGTVDKFVGDEVMVLFGAPYKQENKELMAIKTAIMMQKKYGEILAEFDNKYIKNTALGIGIATGDVIAGEMGNEKRTDYTIIGRVANLGARICSDAGKGEILTEDITYDCVKEKYMCLKKHKKTYKGINRAVDVCKIKY